MRIITKEALEKGKERALLKPRDYMILYCFEQLGLRRAEILLLKPIDFNFDKKYVTVIGKGDKKRDVYFSEKFSIVFQEYLSLKKIKLYDTIFKISDKTVYNIVKKYTGINPHAIRHYYSIRHLDLIKNIFELKNQLGHASISTTQIYLRHAERKQIPDEF